MEIIKQTSAPQSDSPAQPAPFKGYTLDEIRYQRALVALKREFCKSKLLNNVNQVKRHNPLTGNASSPAGKVGSIASKLITGMSYLDYVMIAISVFGTARKVTSFFRKKKK